MQQDRNSIVASHNSYLVHINHQTTLLNMSTGTRSQASLLQETLDTALARIEALETQHQAITRENQDLRQRFDSQPAAAQPGSAQPRTSSPPVVVAREPKVAPPETFHGRNKAKLAHFLLGLTIVLESQPSRFPTDKTKINYAISFLRDEAMAWIEPFAIKKEEDQPTFMTDYGLFVKELKIIFGDPDEIATAERLLRQLRQRGPASAYFADFRRLSAVLDWNDPALVSQAYTGLKSKLKDELARVGRPTTLTGLIDTATRLDNRIHERDLEREREAAGPTAPTTPFSSTKAQSTGRPPAATSATIKTKAEHTSGDNTGTTRRGPLTDNEKERRRREGLCLYCASKDHVVNDCPVAANRGSNRQARVSSPTPSGN